MILTKHEGETFLNQTVYVSGQAFIRCKFVGCTLVLREGAYHWEENQLDRCNWHIDRLVMWGNPDSIRDIRSLLEMLEQGQRQIAEQLNAQGGQPAANPTTTD